MNNRFHAYKSVAPLKPLRLCARAAGSARFHAYKSVAPLKHTGHKPGVDNCWKFYYHLFQP